MKPCDIIGIPNKFQNWRPYQEEAVNWILEQWDNDREIIALEASTGSGKSVTAVAAAKLANLKTIYCVSTRQLQEQLAGDFEDAVVIWGRQHYPCPRFPHGNLTAADCTHREYSPCPKIYQCPYKLQKALALKSNLCIVNYAFFLHEANYVGEFSGNEWELLVCDEGDLMDDELLKFVQVTITRKQLDRCEIEPPKFKTKFKSWLEWAEPTILKVEKSIADLDNTLGDYLEEEIEPPLDLMHQVTDYSRLYSKLNTFKELVDENWIAELNSHEKWEFKPIFVRGFGDLFTKHCSKLLAMSATMQGWAWNLGIEDEVPFHRTPSTFPPENCPIIFLPVANFSKETTDDEAITGLVRTIDAILDNYKGKKGIIHTVSYKIANILLMQSKHDGRLISHQEAGARAEVLAKLKESSEPLVLTSPGFGRGVDLPYDDARFGILCKLPFGDLGDKQTAKRRWSGKSGERWYLLECVRAIVQARGRIMRAPDDHGDFFILDQRFESFYAQMKDSFPREFREAIVW